MNESVVIVGAGHAGGVAAALLRQHGFAGRIALLGEEPELPYQRPPLSKAWLKGEADADALALKPADFYAEAGIDLRIGTPVERLDRSNRRVALRGGGSLSYDLAILATGARPIRLQVPGADLTGVLELRTSADAEALKRVLGPGRRTVVVGGGYIGLEVAASAVTLGGSAAVLERASRLLARSASAPIARFFQDRHEANGVRVRVNAEVVGFEGAGGRVTGVRLASGEIEACDLVVVGVGVLPNIDLARAAGLVCDRGIVVDDRAQTSDPRVYAIGDCTVRPAPLYGRMVCPESVPSALEQAKQAAAHIAGRDAPAIEVPWNWSDQYDVKLQVAGFPFDVDELVIRGDPSSGRFAVFHLGAGKVRQVEAINAAPEFMAGRQLILRQSPVEGRRLADVAVSMKEVAT